MGAFTFSPHAPKPPRLLGPVHNRKRIHARTIKRILRGGNLHLAGAKDPTSGKRCFDLLDPLAESIEKIVDSRVKAYQFFYQGSQ